jgi:hypothetical protein
MRLILHTAAYWLILTMRDAIRATHALATTEFTTIRLRLLKRGTRVIETASASALLLPRLAQTLRSFAISRRP